jgi:type IV pilus assembly protein PilV
MMASTSVVRQAKESVYVKSHVGKLQSGMTLIEILITMVILAIGLLGLAGLMLEGLRNNQGAYLRTQASIYAYDMADRIRINSDSALGAAYDNFTTAEPAPDIPSCATATSGCSPADLATLDMAEWAQQINGSGGIVMLPQGVGTVSRTNRQFTIAVTWTETRWDDTAGEGGKGAETVKTQQFSLVFQL